MTNNTNQRLEQLAETLEQRKSKLMQARENYTTLDTLSSLHLIAAAPFETAGLSILYLEKIVNMQPLYAALTACAMVSLPFLVSYAGKALAHYKMKKIESKLNEGVRL